LYQEINWPKFVSESRPGAFKEVEKRNKKGISEDGIQAGFLNNKIF